MVSSMTGYGRGEATGEGKTVTIEMKSVNHRFLETMVRLPRAYTMMEDRIKSVLKSNFDRGRIDVFVNVEETGEKKRRLKVDKELAMAYYSSLKELAQFLDISENLGVLAIAGLPEVLTIEEPEEDSEAFWPVMESALEGAIRQLLRMRREEGRKLAVDLLNRKDIILQYVKEIEERSQLVVEEYRVKLTARIEELLGSVPVDENRLALEVALYADRSSITEELVRLYSHLEQLQQSLEGEGPVGRKLDFLVQEMHREINTIGSKSSDLLISQKVVAIKSEVEKIREQVQNLE
ncbi:YicC/YloC family endoribonuclease [Zhaonella formicivorans]|uniref:YicC/YloC family endoribonuclease n=1 Tax=Zhaonella formicivorans TaxID=2528593 RepID=UPI0010D0AAE2|nr:YicC/YloC family endoribonuclease [Zhaonella formicivorans]